MNRCLLCEDIALVLLSCVPGACPARYRIISCLIWKMLWLTYSHSKVCRLLLKDAFELCLFAAIPSLIESFLVLFGRIVSGWMFAKDKVCPSKFIDMLLPLPLGVKLSSLEIPTVYLLL